MLTPRLGVGRGRRHWGVPRSGSKAFKGHTRAESSENRVNMIYNGAWVEARVRPDCATPSVRSC
jgi:hypothetical protein